MFAYISEKLTNRFIQQSIIDYSSREIYLFGLEQLFTTLLNIITTVIIGILLGEFWQGFLFVVLFMVLRSYAGGYHASTSARCYLLTSVIIAIALSVIKYINFNMFVCLGLLMISGVVILVLSPVEAKNKPLDNIEYVIYRKKAVVIWATEFVCAIVCLVLNLGDLSECVMMAHIILALSQLSAKVEYKRN